MGIIGVAIGALVISVITLGIVVKTRIDLWKILEKHKLVKSKEQIKAEAFKKIWKFWSHNKKEVL